MLKESIIGSGKPLIIVETDPFYTMYGTKFSYDSSDMSLKIVNGSGANRIGFLSTLRDQYGLDHRRIIIKNSSGDVLYFALIKTQILNSNSDKLYVDDLISLEQGGKRVGANIALTSDTYTITLQDVAIKLPYTQELTETYIPKFRVWNMFNGNKEKDLLGYKYKANLDYSSFTNRDFFTNAKALFTAMKGVLDVPRRNMIFYPRMDNYSVSYRVDFEDDAEMTMAVIKGFGGHKYFAIPLEGLDLLREILVTATPDDYGYGDCYGGNQYLTYGYIL